jgi:hypothetical protein
MFAAGEIADNSWSCTFLNLDVLLVGQNGDEAAGSGLGRYASLLQLQLDVACRLSRTCCTYISALPQRCASYRSSFVTLQALSLCDF